MHGWNMVQLSMTSPRRHTLYRKSVFGKIRRYSKRTATLAEAIAGEFGIPVAKITYLEGSIRPGSVRPIILIAGFCYRAIVISYLVQFQGVFERSCLLLMSTGCA